MATPTSEGDVLSDEAKAEESRTPVDTAMDEETFAEPNEKIYPTKESYWKKLEGAKHMMKVVSSIGENEGGKLSLVDTCSWEQKVDEAYTELILCLQEAWETHLLKIRSQLRQMIAQPWPKGTPDYDPKSLFNIEPAEGPTKEQKKGLLMIVLISVSVALLAICVVNSVRIEGLRHELAVINQKYDFLQETIGDMMKTVNRLPENIRKQNLTLIEEMRKDIRYALQNSSRENEYPI